MAGWTEQRDSAWSLLKKNRPVSITGRANPMGCLVLIVGLVFGLRAVYDTVAGTVSEVLIDLAVCAACAFVVAIMRSGRR